MTDSPRLYSRRQPTKRGRPSKEPFTPRIVTNYDELVRAMRERRQHLGLSGEDLDAKTSLPDRYAAKLEVGARGYGKLSLNLTLQALALEMIVVPKPQEPREIGRVLAEAADARMRSEHDRTAATIRAIKAQNGIT